MTRTEDRLTDALGAAARALPQDTLRPIVVPERRRRHPAWTAPAAAAAGLLLVVGLGVAVAARIPGTGQAARPGRSPGATRSPGAATAPPRYYVDVGSGNKTVVRATATGAVTATVPVPHHPGPAETGVLAAAGNGKFFIAAFVPGASGERIYQFRLTGSGQVSGFSLVPGGAFAGSQQADAMAASPDGSQVAVAINVPFSLVLARKGPLPDEIVVINVRTGARSVWRGGTSRPASSFNVASLSWTGDGRELVFLGQWCGQGSTEGIDGNEVCGATTKGPIPRHTEVWTLDPAAGGGRLDSGHRLLSQSARYPYLAQALISPDGLTLTALVLSGPVPGHGSVPGHLSVVRISVATGRQQGVLYQKSTGVTAGWYLSSDGPGRHWLLDGIPLYGGGDGPARLRDLGFNGWIDGGRLAPLQPRGGNVTGVAW